MAKRNNGDTAPSGDANETTTIDRAIAIDDAATAKTRKKREVYQYRLEQLAMMADTSITCGPPVMKPVGEGIYDTANYTVCDDMADGMKKAAEAKVAGKFRVVKIMCEFEVKLETKTEAKIV